MPAHPATSQLIYIRWTVNIGSRALCPFHTADADKSAVWTEMAIIESRLSATENFESENVQYFCSFVQSRNAVWTEFYLVL